ncbi:PP2C family protein-serine/threonine phosphatase [Streptomyces niveus]|uniref:Serine/threonine protein phosphatase n=1 Tax=Streptomyces niveus TaxID=193462 RepID=A0A1U9QP17_STRNV|nr:PP2C family protein-serine/threonine phosphatase [Streptomyces niveus]AQU65521.1 serine/threonine protein phosphatase [Streptomyces niveus]
MSLIRSSRTLFTLARALPFMVLLAVLGIELSPAHFLYTGPLLSPAPALAAVTMGPAGTGSVAIMAGVLSTVTATQNHAWGTPQVYSNLLALLVVSVASLATSTARVHREKELETVRRIAQVSQDVVLRPVPARLEGVRAAGVYLAAEEGARIGGDLYEVLATPFGIRIIVGDVRGKGLPAVRSAAAVLGAFREAADYEPELPDTVTRCEAALRRELTRTQSHGETPEPSRDPAEEFVTVVIAQITGAPVVELVSRGHPPPLLLRRGETTSLETASPLPPLGLEEFLSSPPVPVERYPFEHGDRLLLYTDGVLEARDPARNFFDLPTHLAQLHDLAPQALLDRLRASLLHHTKGRLADDAAMIIVERDTHHSSAQAPP